MSGVSSKEDLSPATPVCTATSSVSITPSLPNLLPSHHLMEIYAGLSTIDLQQQIEQLQRLLGQKTGALPQPESEQKQKLEAPAEVQIKTRSVLKEDVGGAKQEQCLSLIEEQKVNIAQRDVVQPEPQPEVGIEQFSIDNTPITASQQ